jgi:hypothetical protein
MMLIAMEAVDWPAAGTATADFCKDLQTPRTSDSQRVACGIVHLCATVEAFGPLERKMSWPYLVALKTSKVANRIEKLTEKHTEQA